jgi:hypothetical protein
MRLPQTKELLHSKGNCHQTQQTAHKIGENLCQLLIQKGTQNLQGNQKTQPPKINIPMKKWAYELHREFSKEEVQMASKHMRKHSTFLVIKEMQIKITLRFHLTLFRMATIKGNNNNKC